MSQFASSELQDMRVSMRTYSFGQKCLMSRFRLNTATKRAVWTSGNV